MASVSPVEYRAALSCVRSNSILHPVADRVDSLEVVLRSIQHNATEAATAATGAARYDLLNIAHQAGEVLKGFG